MKPFIIKASGEKALFSEEKIRLSSRRAGASPQLSDEIARAVKKRVGPSFSSEQIYKCVLGELQKRDPRTAYRYSLKKAIMKLGPAGFLFEKYVARILENYGYSAKVGRVIQGRCVGHEVDVTASKDGKSFMVECKYHNRRGIRSDVKVVLYTFARFLDIKKRKELFHQAWLVTNTKCTSQAIKYANCVDLRIIAWRYPRGRGLEYFIEKKGLYPVTILPSLSKKVIQRLSEANIIVAGDLLKYSVENLTKLVSISPSFAKKIQEEVGRICYPR